jgi:hypothetical protein
MSAFTIPPSDIRHADGSHEWQEQDGSQKHEVIQGDTVLGVVLLAGV